MGGFFGMTSRKDCIPEVFYGTDYHSHLGTRRGGMASTNRRTGMQRKIHAIENAPFRTKFERIFEELSGNAAIGCISDFDPQPLLITSKLGTYAICVVGIINNADELIAGMLSRGASFDAMTGGAINSVMLTAALIGEKDNFADGIRHAQMKIEGTASILILKEDGTLIAARDRDGRLPILVGKNEDGYGVSFESFALQKLDFEQVMELGPGEIVEIHPEEAFVLKPALPKKRICSFLWSYYGYPTSTYEGQNVEVMRYRNGRIMAQHDQESGKAQDIDYVGGVPDSGTPHAIGYANESRIPFARAFIKYTPTWARSFMPVNQSERNRVAHMKQIPVHDLIKDQKLLFVDDSIVRGTQLKETVDFLYANGAKEVHMRSACPPIMYACKYLNFSRSTSDNDLISRRVIRELEGEEGLEHIEEYADGRTERGRKLRETICEKLHFASLEFQTLEGVIDAIGLPECELCTYCWSGKE